MFISIVSSDNEYTTILPPAKRCSTMRCASCRWYCCTVWSRITKHISALRAKSAKCSRPRLGRSRSSRSQEHASARHIGSQAEQSACYATQRLLLDAPCCVPMCPRQESFSPAPHRFLPMVGTSARHSSEADRTAFIASRGSVGFDSCRWYASRCSLCRNTDLCANLFRGEPLTQPRQRLRIRSAVRPTKTVSLHF